MKLKSAQSNQSAVWDRRRRLLVTAPVASHGLAAGGEVVTTRWLKDVVMAKSNVQLEYFHRPISVADTELLRGKTYTFSTYGDTERTYLAALCMAMGARV